MKKLFLSFLAAGLLAGCAKDDENKPSNNSATLIGTWNVVSDKYRDTPNNGQPATESTKNYPAGTQKLVFTATQMKYYYYDTLEIDRPYVYRNDSIITKEKNGSVAVVELTASRLVLQNSSTRNGLSIATTTATR